MEHAGPAPRGPPRRPSMRPTKGTRMRHTHPAPEPRAPDHNESGSWCSTVSACTRSSTRSTGSTRRSSSCSPTATWSTWTEGSTTASRSRSAARNCAAVRFRTADSPAALADVADAEPTLAPTAVSALAAITAAATASGAAAHREMDYLGLEEIPRYLDACEDIYRPLAETLVATGLRISEALALTWDDVDFAARTLRVLRSRKAEGHGSTKGDRFRAV